MSAGIAEIFLLPPASICAECRAAAPAHWTACVFVYCHHSQILATRVPAVGEQWRLVKIAPRSLHKRVGRWRSTGTEILERWARRAAMTPQELDEALTTAWLEFLATAQAPEATKPRRRAHRG